MVEEGNISLELNPQFHWKKLNFKNDSFQSLIFSNGKQKHCEFQSNFSGLY